MRYSTLLCCTLLCFAMPLVFGTAAFCAEWYPGVIHVHTTFSDGTDCVPERVEKAKGLGYKFLIITDHYEQIATTDKPVARSYQRALNLEGVDYGFEDYVRNCTEQTKNGEFVTIPGAEIQAIWQAEPNTYDMSHTLALGSLQDSSSDDPYNLLPMGSGEMPAQAEVISGDPNKLLPKALTQAQMVARVNDKMRMLSVAAHPTLISDVQAKWPQWEHERCRYDLREPSAYGGIRGVEFFNCATVQQNHDVLAWYLSLVKQKRELKQKWDVFVTSGCDSHTSLEPDTPKSQGDSNRWKRVTWVFADSLSTNGILKALGDGQCYAASNGAYIKEMNYRPGKLVQKVDRPAFKFTVSFPTAITAPKTIVMYCDGDEIVDSRRTFKIGLRNLSYEWNDTAASVGEHWYVLWIDGCLVTAPLWIDVQDALESSSSNTTESSGYNDWCPHVFGSNDTMAEAFGGHGRNIAFISNRSGNTSLYFADTKNGVTREVEPLQGMVEQFGISSTGDIILVDKEKRIHLLLRETGNRGSDPFDNVYRHFKTKLTVSTDCFPAWDSNNSLFYADPAGKVHLAGFSIRKRPSPLKRLVKSGGDLDKLLGQVLKDETTLEWEEMPISEQRTFLTARKDANGLSQLCVIDANGQVSDWLTTDHFNAGEGDVGRAGMLVPLGSVGPVVFTAEKDGNSDIYRLSYDGKKVSQVVRLTSDPAKDCNPCWAFYTEKICFVSERSGSKRIWQMDSDGSNQRMLNLE